MKVLIYSAKPFEIPFLEKANQGLHNIHFTPERLTAQTAYMALNFDAVSIFSADDGSEIVLEKLRDFGVNYITLRSAGYDNVNVRAAKRLHLKIANTPKYSPNAIAEHAITLLMAYNRNILKAQNQTLRYNFLLDNLIGFDVNKKIVGIMGVGNIGSVIVKILSGFGCKILVNDLTDDSDLITKYGVDYVSKDIICEKAEIIFIALPLTESTYHLFDAPFIRKIKNKPIVVNISRGAIVDTKAVLNALDEDKLSGYATDVYEKEHGVFFYDHSRNKVNDTLLHRLLYHPKVLLTPHQAFATKEALQNIASTTISNLSTWEEGKNSITEIC